MTDGIHDLLDAHACACNGRDWDTVSPWWTSLAWAEVDGKHVGSGPEAIRKTLHQTWDEGLVARIVEVDGDRALIGYAGPEGHGEPRVMVKIHTGEGLVHGCSIKRLTGPTLA